MKLLDRYPALERDDWLPDGTWPELQGLREEHLRFVEGATKLAEEQKTLRERFEAEDRQRESALQDGYKDGTDPDLPKTTSKAKRADALSGHKERVSAFREAFNEFLERAVWTIKANEETWTEDLDKQATGADAKREEARRLLSEADAEVRDLERLRRWLRRTAGHPPLGGDHIPFADLPAQPEERPVDLAAVAGGMVSSA